jgi:squalene synthase HpnC
MELAQAQAWTRNLARTHYENFTVGSWMLPRSKRQHVFNLYAFARTVDDLGDEFDGDRLAALNAFEAKLRACHAGADVEEPLFTALRPTIRKFEIPIEPFLKLIDANRMDQTRKRHATIEDLIYYCDFSANPCGHLFLYAFGYRDKARQSLADCTCTALQLTNFWQDVAVDYRKGRIYLPLEDLRRFGYREEDLAGSVVNDAFRELMRFEIERTRDLFRRGLALADHVRGAVRTDIRLFTRGGMWILDSVEANDFDVYRRRPTLSAGAKARLMLGALLGG